MEARVRVDGDFIKEANPGPSSCAVSVTAKYEPWLQGDEKPPNPSKGETLDVGAIAETIRTDQDVGHEVAPARAEGGEEPADEPIAAAVDEAAGCACYSATHDGTTHMTGVTREETNMNGGGHPGAPPRGEFVGLFELYDGVSGPCSELIKILEKLERIRARQSLFGAHEKHRTYLYDYPVWGKTVQKAPRSNGAPLVPPNNGHVCAACECSARQLQLKPRQAQGLSGHGRRDSPAGVHVAERSCIACVPPEPHPLCADCPPIVPAP